MILNINKNLPGFKDRFNRGYNNYMKELKKLEKEGNLAISVEQKEILEITLELKVLYEEILFPLFGVGNFYEALNNGNSIKNGMKTGEKISIQINNYLFENKQFEEVTEIQDAFFKMLKDLDFPQELLFKGSLQQVIEVIRGI